MSGGVGGRGLVTPSYPIEMEEIFEYKAKSLEKIIKLQDLMLNIS